MYRRLLRRVWSINGQQQPDKAAQIPLPLLQRALAVQVRGSRPIDFIVSS